MPGLVSAGIGALLSSIPSIEEFIIDDTRFCENPYPFQLFAYLVGFVLVFRTNFGYLRYWEAMDDVQTMGSKWLDAAVMTIAFDAPGDASQPFLQSSVMKDCPAINETEIAMGESRSDLQKEAMLKSTEKAMENIQVAGVSKGVAHVEFFVEVVHLFSLMHALALQHLRHDDDLSNLDSKAGSNLTRMTFMKEKPKSTVSKSSIALFGFFSQKRGFKQDDESLKLRVLGGLTKAEKDCLLTDSQGEAISTAARVTMVESWLMRRVTARQKHEPAGDMGKTAPPILSRMVQNISDGHFAWSQASKVAETPFPFPYANLIRIFLWLSAIGCPFVINAKLLPPSARFLVNFVAVWAYFSLAEVGDNMEDPFQAYDPNDLPLEAILHSFNARLLSFGVIPHSDDVYS